MSAIVKLGGAMRDSIARADISADACRRTERSLRWWQNGVKEREKDGARRWTSTVTILEKVTKLISTYLDTCSSYWNLIKTWMQGDPASDSHLSSRYAAWLPPQIAPWIIFIKSLFRERVSNTSVLLSSTPATAWATGKWLLCLRPVDWQNEFVVSLICCQRGFAVLVQLCFARREGLYEEAWFEDSATSEWCIHFPWPGYLVISI